MRVQNKAFANGEATLFRVIKLLALRERLLIGLTLIIRVALVSLDLLGIFLIGAVVSLLSGTIISPASQFGSLLGWLDGFGIKNSYAVILSVAACFFIAKGVISVALNRATAQYLGRVEWQKGVQIFENLLGQPLDVVEKFPKQETVFALTQSVTVAITRATLIASIIAGEAALLLGISIYLLITDALLFLTIALFFLLVVLAMNYFVTRASAIASNKMQNANFASQGVILDILGSFRQIATSPNRATLVKQFSNYRKVYSTQNAEHQTIMNLPRYITEIAVMVGVGLLVLQRAVGDQAGASATVIAVFLTGIFRIVSSLVPLQSALSSWKSIEIEAGPALRILESFEFSDHIEYQLENGAPRPLQVDLKDVVYFFHDKKVIKNINLTVSPGQFVAIVGKSGSGKSTLADLVLGLRVPASGSVYIDGVSARNYVTEYSGRVAYVPQNSQLLHGTLRENVSLNFDSYDDKETQQVQLALSKAGLGTLTETLPNGIDTEIGQNAHNLSGGEIQRIAIARALYRSPGLIVLDEATSALDSSSQQEVQESIHKLRGHVTLLVIAHRKETIDSADIVVTMNNGRIIDA